jgi:hypothetical protein
MGGAQYACVVARDFEDLLVWKKALELGLAKISICEIRYGMPSTRFLRIFLKDSSSRRIAAWRNIFIGRRLLPARCGGAS